MEFLFPRPGGRDIGGGLSSHNMDKVYIKT